jgi:hypothetical protein
MSRRTVRQCDGCHKGMIDGDEHGWRTVVGNARVDICSECFNAYRCATSPEEEKAAIPVMVRLAWLVLNSGKTGTDAMAYDKIESPFDGSDFSRAKANRLAI